MEQVWGSARYRGPGGVVTIGNFDGVHLGHRALLQRARALERGPVLAYTFHPAPRDILRPGEGPVRIQRLEDRIASLLEAGADVVIVEPFDRDFAQLTPEEFASLVLQERLRATGIVVGWDFRFGRGRAGGADRLRRTVDIPVIQVPAVEVDGEPVSSSRIRSLLHAGEVRRAARLLGRPHVVVGEVVRGHRRGRTLGIPTANLRTTTPLVPADGVYAVRCGERIGVANIGRRPTFSDMERAVEVHLVDFDGDLYGQELQVQFHERLRDEQRFPDREALVAQIHRDIAQTRERLDP